MDGYKCEKFVAKHYPTLTRTTRELIYEQGGVIDPKVYSLKGVKSDIKNCDCWKQLYDELEQLEGSNDRDDIKLYHSLLNILDMEMNIWYYQELLLQDLSTVNSIKDKDKKFETLTVSNSRKGDINQYFYNHLIKFCSKYPFISYVLLKSGNHDFLGVAGDHPYMIQAIFSNNKVAYKKYEYKLCKTKEIVTNPKDSTVYPSIAAWAAFSYSIETLRKLLVDVDEINAKKLIQIAINGKNVVLLKVIDEKGWKGIKTLMEDAIIRLDAIELPKYVSIASFEPIVEKNAYRILEMLLSVPGNADTIQNRFNVLHTLDLALQQGLMFNYVEDIDDYSHTITILSRFFEFRRFVTLFRFQGVKNVRHDLLGFLIEKKAWNSVMAICKLVDLQTPMFYEAANKSLSPLLVILDTAPASIISHFVSMYDVNKVSLLYSSAKYKLIGAVKFLLMEYEYEDEMLTNAICISKSSSIVNLLLDKLKRQFNKQIVVKAECRVRCNFDAEDNLNDDMSIFTDAEYNRFVASYRNLDSLTDENINKKESMNSILDYPMGDSKPYPKVTRETLDKEIDEFLYRYHNGITA